MQAWQWLILVVVVAVLIPLVPYVLRKIDFQRQLRGISRSARRMPA